MGSEGMEGRELVLVSFWKTPSDPFWGLGEGRGVDLLSLSGPQTSPVSSRGRCMRGWSWGGVGGRMVKEGH